MNHESVENKLIFITEQHVKLLKRLRFRFVRDTSEYMSVGYDSSPKDIARVLGWRINKETNELHDVQVQQADHIFRELSDVVNFIVDDYLRVKSLEKKPVTRATKKKRKKG